MAEEFSTTALTELLEKITYGISTGAISQESQEHLWNLLTFDKDEPTTKEMVQCLFTGWWVRSLATDSN